MSEQPTHGVPRNLLIPGSTEEVVSEAVLRRVHEAVPKTAVTMVMGSRGCGKSAMARHLLSSRYVNVSRLYAERKLLRLLGDMGTWQPTFAPPLAMRGSTRTPEPSPEPWVEVSHFNRLLQPQGLVSVTLNTGWPSAPNVLQELGVASAFLVRKPAGENLAASLGWSVPDEFLDDIKALVEELAARTIRYVRRKIARTAGRTRAVRPSVRRPAVRPLTMSVTAHAPPSPSNTEGHGVLRRNLLAA